MDENNEDCFLEKLGIDENDTWMIGDYSIIKSGENRFSMAYPKLTAENNDIDGSEKITFYFHEDTGALILSPPESD